MEILFLILLFIFGYVLGWIRATSGLIDKILKDPDWMMKLIKDYKSTKINLESISEESPTRKIKVERHGDMLYLFAEDNDEFLAQGKTLQEALEIVEKRYPNKTFIGHLGKDEANSLGITVK